MPARAAGVVAVAGDDAGDVRAVAVVVVGRRRNAFTKSTKRAIRPAPRSSCQAARPSRSPRRRRRCRRSRASRAARSCAHGGARGLGRAGHRPVKADGQDFSLRRRARRAPGSGTSAETLVTRHATAGGRFLRVTNVPDGAVSGSAVLTITREVPTGTCARARSDTHSSRRACSAAGPDKPAVTRQGPDQAQVSWSWQSANWSFENEADCASNLPATRRACMGAVNNRKTVGLLGQVRNGPGGASGRRKEVELCARFRTYYRSATRKYLRMKN